MRISLSLVILLISVSSCQAQPGKIGKQLTDGFTFLIGPEWRQVGNDEMRKYAKEKKVDFDEYMKNQPFLAWFYYIPKDSAEMPRVTNITIEVYNAKDSTGHVSLHGSKDTIQTDKPFLAAMRDRGYYYDKITGSYIVKYKTQQITMDHSFPTQECLGIEQKKLVDNKIVLIRYTCLQRDEKVYLDQFEKMIASFK